MKQADKAKKAVAREGGRTQFAKALSRDERTKRTQHYRKGAKSNLSRARRRLDKETITIGRREGMSVQGTMKAFQAFMAIPEPDFRDLLLRMVQRLNPVPGPHFKQCHFCHAMFHMGDDPVHRADCIVVEVRRALGQPHPLKAFRPDAENKWRTEEFNARWGFKGG